MPSEKGGRADKAGNEYEKDCIIFEFLKIISEKITALPSRRLVMMKKERIY